MCSEKYDNFKGELAFVAAVSKSAVRYGERQTPVNDYKSLADAGIKVLRRALAIEPHFASAAHVLANTLLSKQQISPTGLTSTKEEVISEARNVLVQSFSGTSVKKGPGNIEEHSTLDSEVGEGSRTVHYDYDEAVQVASDLSELLVITVASEERSELAALRQSVQSLGFDMAVLGMGGVWGGLGQKVLLLRDHLHMVEDNRVVMFVDAFDVLMLGRARQTVELYRSFDADLVFGAETACSPDIGAALLLRPLQVEQASQTLVPFRFLNSGTYMGTAWAIKAMLEEIIQDLQLHHTTQGAEPQEVDDQRWFTRFFLQNQASPGMTTSSNGEKNTHRIVLDHYGSIFHTLHGVDPSLLSVELGEKDAEVASQLTSSKPCVIHGNGDSMELFRYLARELSRQGWPLPQ